MGDKVTIQRKTKWEPLNPTHSISIFQLDFSIMTDFNQKIQYLHTLH